MEAEFTPGPWTTSRCLAMNEFNVRSDSDGGHVGRITWSARFNRRDVAAHSALLAAAPDLYSALESIVRIWETRASNELVGQMIEEQAIAPAMLALKKARGE